MNLLALPIAATDVSSTTDRFRCVPYRCTLIAGACLGRQVKALELGPDAARMSTFSHCFDCADGKAMAGRLGARPVVQLCENHDCQRGAKPGERYCEHCRRGKQLPRSKAALTQYPTPPRARRPKAAPTVVIEVPEAAEPVRSDAAEAPVAMKEEPMPKSLNLTDEQMREHRKAYLKEYRLKKKAEGSAKPRKRTTAAPPPQRAPRTIPAPPPVHEGSFGELARLCDTIGLPRVLTVLRAIAEAAQ